MQWNAFRLVLRMFQMHNVCLGRDHSQATLSGTINVDRLHSGPTRQPTNAESQLSGIEALDLSHTSQVDDGVHKKVQVEQEYNAGVKSWRVHVNADEASEWKR